MLHTAMAWAASEDIQMIDRNPLAGAKFEYHTKAENRDWIPLERVLALFAASEGRPSNIVWRTLFETGARKGEILGANVEDLDVEGHRLWIDKISDPLTYGMTVVRRTKGKTNRWVELSPELTEDLRQLAVGRAPGDPLLPGHDGRRINFNTYRSWWLRDMAAAGLSGYSAHQLRHSFATLGMVAGVSVNVLASMLGHASAVTTLNVYAGTSDDLRKDAAAAIRALVADRVANFVAN
jgi:integrase